MVRSVVPRCEQIRGTHRPNKVAGLIGTRVAKTILASGITSCINRPDIWTQAIRSNLTKLLCHGGRPHMGPGSEAGTTSRYAFAFSRRTAPEVCKVAPPQKKRAHATLRRARGRPGARCTRGLVCKTCEEKRTRAYRFSGGIPAFPAQWFYGLYVVSPVTGLVDTVIGVSFPPT